MDSVVKAKIDSLYEAFSVLANGAYTYVTDMRTDWTRWSKEAVHYFGLPDEYMQGVAYAWMEKIHPDDRAAYKENIDKVMSGQTNEHNLQYRVLTKDGRYIVCTCRGVLLRDEHGNPDYFGGMIKNNDSLSYYDDVSNMRSLYGFLEDLRSTSWRGESLQVMILGINDFSRLNEIYGYTFGNRVLQEFSKMIKVEAHGLGNWYRMDGTKFAIVCFAYAVQQGRCRAFYGRFLQGPAFGYHRRGRRRKRLPYDRGRRCRNCHGERLRCGKIGGRLCHKSGQQPHGRKCRKHNQG